MHRDYMNFVDNKRLIFEPVGFDVPSTGINPALSGKYQFQSDILRWALRRGKAATFLDCGLGKSFIEGEFAKLVNEHTGLPVLVIAPLGVSMQLRLEFAKLGYNSNICKEHGDLTPGINITNYERADRFDPTGLGGIILDESSILKGRFGITRQELTDFAANIPFKLCGTATPAPNDFEELIYHAVFLGIMSEAEIKALFFTQDGNSSNKFRLKRHAEQHFWRWVASWAVAMRKPSDLGYSNDGFDLPKLNIHEIKLDVDLSAINTGQLFVMDAQGIDEQRQFRQATLEPRIQAVADLVGNNHEQWVVWCKYNPESEGAQRAIFDAVEVTGSDTPEKKEYGLLGFSKGYHRVLVTKAEIAGFGMNWQNCHKTVLLGWDNSYEQFYQLTRRFWRHGQQNDVDVYILTTDADGSVIQNMKRKEAQADKMFDEIIRNMSVWTDLSAHAMREEMPYREDTAHGTDWTLYLGDSVLTMDKVETESVGMSVFSPPFPGMYVYSNSPHDIGNVKDIDQMVEQFRYLVDKNHLYRIMMPGRNVFIHLTQAVAQKQRDGYIGLKDFRGRVIRMMEEEGWVYYGEITIDKNPQVKATRTNDHGLMFKSLATDSAKMHVAMPDYVLQFRKPGDNPYPIRAGISDKYNNPNGWITSDEWILWARPVWYAADYNPHNGLPCKPHEGIKETNVLNVSQARDTNDERHLCPLQLDCIERIVKLWSNPGDIVYSPFAGIGSEGVVALKHGRKFVGGELKKSYWRNAQRQLNNAASQRAIKTLFDLPEMQDRAPTSLFA